MLGAAFLVAAAALFLVALLGNGADPASRPAGFHRLGFASGHGVVDLGSGTWVGYFETPSETGAPGSVPPFRAVVRGPDGAQVNVENYAGKPLDYRADGKRGSAVLEFQAPQSGRYAVTLQAPGAALAGTDLAIGRRLGYSRSSSSEHAQLVIATLAALAGLAVLAWPWVQRVRQRRVVGGAS